MGRPFVEELEGDVYCCGICSAHLALAHDLLSKGFHSRNGKAYLFSTVSNCVRGRTEERIMTTGGHWVKDLHCSRCNNLLGWFYEKAEEESQKYKEGKCILERAKVDSAFVPTPRSSSTFSAWSNMSAGSSGDSEALCL